MNEPNAMVCRVLKAKYFHRGDFISSSVGQNPSYNWRSIWTTKDWIWKDTHWKISFGDRIIVWNQPWLDSNDDFFVRTPLVQGFEDMVNLTYPGDIFLGCSDYPKVFLGR